MKGLPPARKISEILLAASMILLVSCGGGTGPAEGPGETDETRTTIAPAERDLAPIRGAISSEELHSRIFGASEDEVLAMLGPPDYTDEGNRRTLYYPRVAVIVDGGMKAPSFGLSGGRVRSISFQDRGEMLATIRNLRSSR